MIPGGRHDRTIPVVLTIVAVQSLSPTDPAALSALYVPRRICCRPAISVAGNSGGTPFVC